MKQSSIFLLLLLCISHSAFSQLKTPEQFLGYKVGTRFTPHWKIVSYFQHVAEQAPARMKLEQYGQTNEQRPLYISIISTEENLKQLDFIRTNNLRLANLASDRAMPQEQTPVLVWLSYNVHGNEASSSESAMMALYEFVNPANAQVQGWLKNTVIILDPCLNPDGRDRYVNWYNSMQGRQYDARIDSREHREPWPSGRSNHYYFDLNRDWVWQTQVETQQRIKVYQKWMPQIHVDFHEQGINSPYYFAPAAEPYHELITKWQREFQYTIGRNHARHFDDKGWLYFTREVFDLFYPSYGDTYPTFNGAIGMTYEQGGSGAAGLAVQTEDQDTLTLADRVLHHYTTALSTVEVASANAQQLIKEYRQYFNNAVKGTVGEYKSYVIRFKERDELRLRAFCELLNKNGIEYGRATGTVKAMNYHTGKEESVTIGSEDIVISNAQPRASLLQVLMDPQPRLVDSITYDITAWALPYAYGINAFASRQAVTVRPPTAVDSIVNKSADMYGYAFRWQGMPSARVLAKLLQDNIRVRVAEKSFIIHGKTFDAGTVMILKKGNEHLGTQLWRKLAKHCNDEQVRLHLVTTGFVDEGYDFGSSKVRSVKKLKIGMFTGETVSSLGSGEVWHFFDKQLEYPVSLFNVADYSRINWKELDVLIMPSGNYRFLQDKAQSAALQQWIMGGGRLIALESAVAQLATQDWTALKIRKDESNEEELKKNPYLPLKIYGDREKESITQYTPGSIYRVEADSTHPLMFGFPGYYYTLKMDDVVYDYIKAGGWNAGIIKKDNQLSGFVGYKLKKKLIDGLVFGSQPMGRGSIVYLTDNVLFRNFWENGKLMMANAVFMH